MVSSSRSTRRQLSHEIYEHLRDRILVREYGPGQQLPIRALARELGVSVTPVRDAINLLAAEGLISVSPRKGTVVAPFSVTDVREFYEVRLLLEPPAAALAASGLSTEELIRLETLLAEMESAPRQFTDVSAYIRHLVTHAEFHTLIVGGARNERLEAFYASLARYLIVARSIYPANYRSQTDRPYEHRDIVDALRRRDGVAARRAVEVHLVRAAADILNHLAQSPPPTDGQVTGTVGQTDPDEAQIDRMALARLDVLTGGRHSGHQEKRLVDD